MTTSWLAPLARDLQPQDARYAEGKANDSAALGPFLLPRASRERELNYVNEEDRLWYTTFILFYFYLLTRPRDFHLPIVAQDQDPSSIYPVDV